MDPLDAVTTTAAWYTTFAERDARHSSPLYADWAAGVAADPELLDLIDTLPPAKRQPNLVLGAARFLGVDEASPAELRRFLRERWAEVAAVVARRRTQTNVPGRCATMLPVLASIAGPVALLEVGASAGLCLVPDRYSYRYTHPGGTSRLDPGPGPSEVVLDCTLDRVDDVPERLPEVVWRAGIDLAPLDVADAEDLAWLDALIWPGHETRRTQTRAAARLVRAEPPLLVAGDLNERLADVAAQAPAGARLVVFHSAVLAYLDAEARARFTTAVQGLDATWISNEGQPVLPEVAERLPAGTEAGHRFVLAVDGAPRALVDPHGSGWSALG
ncbi:DUF2332 domain-containing protein [Actinotalea sp.]|uniref:DUF2332 domain-containing protein n=1 Tax=Actinotalea sp. TaxID=1872145 RepID=UPI0035690994